MSTGRYIRIHELAAEPMTRGEYVTGRGWALPADEDPDDPGYRVCYADGYVSWCPKEQFERAAIPMDRHRPLREVCAGAVPADAPPLDPHSLGAVAEYLGSICGYGVNPRVHAAAEGGEP